MTAPLTQYACQDACQWRPDPTSSSVPPRFACTGCGSQWDRTQLWTPVDRDGRVSEAVRREVARSEGT